ncbi:MAG: hypothetical protein VX949_07110 [Planctomycetota bacterium]|nr:hypothetical protein [Planctomycetota bacterium]
MTMDDLIDGVLTSRGREQKKLLKQVFALDPGKEEAIRLAPALRDPSPRVSARITALLARHRLLELFEQQLEGLKPGKISILRAHFDRISARGDDQNS